MLAPATHLFLRARPAPAWRHFGPVLAFCGVISGASAQEPGPDGIGSDFLSDLELGGVPFTGETVEDAPSAAATAPDPWLSHSESATPSSRALSAPDPRSDSTAPIERVEAPAPQIDPRDMLAELWRQAVADGRTTMSFDTWLAEVVQQSPPAVAPLDQSGRTELVSSQWTERTAPIAMGQAGRIVTTFGAAIPVAYCSPLTVCMIELEPGEELTDTPSMGDTVRWQFTVKQQGEDPQTVILEVKPASDASRTNLVIPTNRRLYTITLVNDLEVHTPILSFRYPDSEARALAEAIAARDAEGHAAAEAAAASARAAEEARQARLAASGVETQSGTTDASDLDFNFRITGQAPFRPVRVFSDGERTYIDLHPSYRGEVPAIVAGSGESNAALNTRVTGGGSRLEADRVITDIWLQSGRDRVRIRRGGA